MMLLCIIFYWHFPLQAAGVLFVWSVVKILAGFFCRSSLMLSCYVASTRLLISRTVIDAPFNYSSIRIDILHFPRRVEQGTWLRCWWLRLRRMTFLMLWRANNWGEVGGSAFCWKRKGPRKETKIEKPFLKSKWTIFNQNEQFSLKFTHSQIKMTHLKSKWLRRHFCFLFDDVALNTISLRLSVSSWPFGTALPNTVSKVSRSALTSHH